MTHFICVSGQARHGKDTAAEIMQEILTGTGYSVLVTHYADLLKFICKKYFGWNGEKDDAGRTILQYVGTDCIRKQDPSYWVDFIANIVRMFPNKWDFVIVPDCRFENEIERLSDAYFPVTHVRVVRPDFDNGLTEGQKNHASETALKDCSPDVLLKNTTMSALREQVQRFCIDVIVERKEYMDEGN